MLKYSYICAYSFKYPIFVAMNNNRRHEMKTYLFLLLAGIAGLVSCSNDDDRVIPVEPELNKLTKVSCYKNDAATPEYTVNITYTNEGKIFKIEERDRYSSQFTYDGNTISVSNFVLGNAGLSMPERFTYSLSDGVIVKEEQWVRNEIANEVYCNSTYLYGYDRYNMYTTSWIVRLPEKNGKGYEERRYDNVYQYTWQDGNVVRYAEIPHVEMVYEYTNQLRPQNFPLRVKNTTRPVGFGILTPVNLMLGNMNRYMPSRAYWYNVPEINDKCAEYTFTYAGLGDYINDMNITEKIYATSGNPAEENVYKYTFEYNFVVKK